MNNEIKEILKELKQHTWLEYEEMDKLLDYITNLQEKYDRMKENAEILSNGYNELEKRNEKAIEYINYWGIDEEHNDDKLLRSILKKILNILEGDDKE